VDRDHCELAFGADARTGCRSISWLGERLHQDRKLGPAETAVDACCRSMIDARIGDHGPRRLTIGLAAGNAVGGQRGCCECGPVDALMHAVGRSSCGAGLGDRGRRELAVVAAGVACGVLSGAAGHCK
jgi:hypothetical protein